VGANSVSWRLFNRWLFLYNKEVKKLLVFFVVFGLVGVFAAGIFVYVDQGSGPQYDSVRVVRGDVVQEVSVTGRVVPVLSAELAFLQGGRIVSLPFDIGETVRVGELVARLDDREIVAQLGQAKAGVRGAEAKLAELRRGSRPEEVWVQETRVSNAKAALLDARQALYDALRDAYTRADDAVHGKADELFIKARTDNPDLAFESTDSATEAMVEDERGRLEDVLLTWQVSLEGLSLESDLLSDASMTRGRLDRVKSFLDDVALLVAGLESDYDLSQTTIDGYRATVSGARTTVNTALSGVSTNEEKVQDGAASVALEKGELELLAAGSDPQKIAAGEATLAEAEAKVEQFASLQAQHAIYAPFTGIVTKREVEVGEIVAAHTHAISLIADRDLLIEAFVPEADIAKIELGDTARVTLDAYGDTEGFGAKLSFIDPAETIIEGIATYRTELMFDNSDSRVLPGMTANIDIVGAVRSEAIFIPQRALIRRDDGFVVRVLGDDGSVREVLVEPGLRGSDGTVEIVSGVSVGDRVVTFVRD
jgi:HlyD family secretion protein